MGVKMKVIKSDDIKKLPEAAAYDQQNEKMAKLNFIYDDKGNIKSSSAFNVAQILLNDPKIKGLFKFNEFTEQIDLVKNIDLDLSNFGMPTLKFRKDQLTDANAEDLALYFEANPNYQTTFKPQLILQAIGSVARAQSYNPIVNYLKACHKKWDGNRRLKHFFQTYLGAPDNETTILITYLWFKGAVAKALNPKTKFDWVLDLVGGQGAGKTTLLKKIAPLGAYTDQFTSFTDKDDYTVMRNALIVNDDEMTASNKASFEEIKKFITMQIFEYRRPYARMPDRFLKKFVIARTTNEIKHLKDKSGDRRFITILVRPDHQKKNPVTDLSQDEIDQIWGESMELYKISKDPFILDDKQEELLKHNREDFMYTTGLEEQLYDILDNYYKDAEFIPNKDLALKLMNDPEAFIRERKVSREVRYLMEHKGWKSNVRHTNSKGIKVRGFGR